MQSLALAFVESGLSDVERASQLDKAEELIAKGAVGLGKLITATQTQRVVLVIDQFEEAFTLCKDVKKQQEFFECLLGTLQRDDNKLCLVITMRADFFGKCLEQEYGGLAKKIQDNLVTLTPMSRGELELAIIKPAEQVSLKIEPELVSEMIADVEGSPGSLPLLQYTLTELWKQRTEQQLTLNAYTRLGGVRGTLQTRATEVYESFSPEEQQATKRIFIELTQLGEGTEDTRRQVVQRDLVSSQYSEVLINRVIQRLADEKLVVTNTLDVAESRDENLTQRRKDAKEQRRVYTSIQQGKIAVVDVAHEVLIRHWSLLRKWIEESRDVLRQKRKIEAAAVEWRDRGKAKDYLLQGKRLREAEEFQKQQTDNLRLSDLSAELIQISVRQRRNNRFISVGLLLIISLVASVVLGIVIERQIRISQLKHDLDTAKRQNNRYAFNTAMEKLVKTNESLAHGNFSGADLSFANLSDADLRAANLSFANLGLTNLSGADLRFAYPIGASLVATNLSDANLSRAYLNYADLRGAKFIGAKLISADLSNATLLLALFIGADLRDANLTNADLSYTNLRYAKNLTPEQVKSAKNWDKAIYDKDFRAKLGLPPEPAK
ncbi:pentapeptide repeat-containing protein [Calothrix sp. NIES-2100]|nr:pentapeptide repeat-containing protein [Calothrix sp. NIES-2100]